MLNILISKLNDKIEKGLKAFGYSKDTPASIELLKELTEDQIDELLACSFQKTPKDVFKYLDPGTNKRVAMDACPGYVSPKQWGLEGIGQNIIYTFFAKHGFIGWQLCALLAQHWLIQRACCIPNQDAMRPGWENVLVSEEEDADNNLLNELLEKSEQFYNISAAAVKFGNNRKIFGIAIAFPVVEGLDYSVPFNPDAIKPGSYKGIAVIDPYWCLPSWTVEDTSEPGSLHYYEPEYYSFQFSGGMKKVHRSHLIISRHGQVPDILKPSYYFGGIPLPQMLCERVYAAEKVANEAPLMALTKRLLIADANLETVYAKPEEAKAKIGRITAFRDNFGVFVKNPGDQVQQIDTSLTDFDALIMTQYQLVAGISDIPMFKLLGTQFKGLNPTGEGELKNYIQTLQSLQYNVFKPFIERHNLLSLRSDFQSKIKTAVNFKPIDMPTEKELAEINTAKANEMATLINAGVITPEEARGKLSEDRTNGFNNLSEEMPADLDLEEGAFNTPEGGEGGLALLNKAQDAWEEKKHPRNNDGKFTEGAGGGNVKEPEAKGAEPKNTENKDINNLLDVVFSNKKDLSQEKAYSYRTVNKSEATKLKEKINIDLEGYNHELTAQDIRHIFKQHGNAKTELNRGQIAVNKEDIFLIPEITSNFDDVNLGEDLSENKRVIVYKKKIGDIYFYIESIGGKNKKNLRPKTMYKRKAK